MKVLMTGTDGYLGSVIAPDLISAGHEVTGVDTGFFRSGWLYHSGGRRPATMTKDIREIVLEDLKTFDAVVHLGELSNDPLGDLLGSVTYEVNHTGSVSLASLAKQAGVPRFVYMSSCSVYGSAGSEAVTEDSATAPQTAYAICKRLVERDVAAMADDDFSPVFLRNATAFGASPRMRFDIVLNNLAGLAWTTRALTLSSDGTPWRPLVHALDIATAIRCVLEGPRDAMHNQVFNVGSDDQNYRVKDIAHIVAEVFSGCSISLGSLGSDRRSYRVSFDKIHQRLPGFSCAWNARRGAEQLHAVLSAVDLDPAALTGRRYVRLNQLAHLIRTGQLDERLFWRSPACVS